MSFQHEAGRESGVPQDVDEAAAYWSARRHLGGLRGKDVSTFARWVQEPAHRAAFEAAEAAVEHAGALAADADILRMREAALGAYPSRPRWRNAMLSAAAVVALLAIGVWIGRIPATAPATMPSAAVPSAQDSLLPVRVAAPLRRYATGVGERRDLHLADGSVVALNTASEVVVGYGKVQRSIRMLRGQALFEVAHDAARPFVVVAGDRRITAIGTAFDVRVDETGLRVSIIEGRVRVDPLQRTPMQRLIPMLGRETLVAGEQLTRNASHETSVSVADVSRDVSWRDGRLIFRHDTLAHAVAEINRYSRMQMVIEDPRAADLRISGVFSTARPENFVSAVSASYPVDVRQRAPQVVGLVWREDAPATVTVRPDPGQ